MGEAYLDIIVRVERAEASLKQVQQGMQELQQKSEQANQVMRNQFEKTSKVTNELQGVIAGLFSVGAVTAFIKRMVDLRVEWEKQTAVLKVLTGSQKEAEATMKMIKKVADASLSPLKEVSDAYIRLVNSGIKPTFVEMKKMVDVAVASGKSFGRLAESIFDAANQQTRGLRDFGIQSKIIGDKIQLSFKGMTKIVDLTAEAISGFVIEMGGLKGVAGASEEIGKTVAGAFDDVGDSIESLILTLGELSSDKMVGAFNTLSNIVTILNFVAGNSEKAKTGIIGLILEFNPLIDLNKLLIKGYQELADAIRGNEKALDDNILATEASKKLGFELIKVIDAEGRISYEFKKVAEETKVIIEEVTEEEIKQAGAIELVVKQIEILKKSIPGLSEKELPAAQLALYNLNQELKRLTGLGTETPDIIVEKIKSITDAIIELVDIEIPDLKLIDNLETQWNNYQDFMIKFRQDQVNETKLTEDEKLGIAQEALYTGFGLIDALSQYRRQRMDEELAAAGDNEKKKEEIQRKYAKKEQTLEIARATMGVAQVVINALQTKPFIPLGLAASILAGVLGAVQIGVIKSQKFATGTFDLQGRGTGTSDSIPAMLSRGESVMTAKETKEFYPYLKAMKEGKFPKLQMELMNDFAKMNQINNLNYDNSKEIRKLEEIRKALLREQQSEHIEGKYRVVRRGNITTKISLN